jgi:demethylmenaquinone methyltransferase/2-methoxy-6-polyprenyl-1,4-benzoquinol methylase
MGSLEAVERARNVQEMFGRIAPRYDLMNRIMTGGQDVRWRGEVILRSELPESGRVLDLGAGTGDLARLVQAERPGLKTVAADFTLEMMQIGRSRSPDLLPENGVLSWIGADGTRLPFPEASFDRVISGFLLRNVTDLEGCLREQLRILKSGGRLVALDTTPPTKSRLRPLIEFHMHTIVPMLGRLIAGQPDAYRYLPESTEGFISAEALAEMLKVVGFEQVGFKRRMLGVVAIHWAVKP